MQRKTQAIYLYVEMFFAMKFFVYVSESMDPVNPGLDWWTEGKAKIIKRSPFLLVVYVVCLHFSVQSSHEGNAQKSTLWCRKTKISFI